MHIELNTPNDTTEISIQLVHTLWRGWGINGRGCMLILFILIFFMWKQAGDHRLVGIRVRIMAL